LGVAGHGFNRGQRAKKPASHSAASQGAHPQTLPPFKPDKLWIRSGLS
jgi:hypothetical protein